MTFVRMALLVAAIVYVALFTLSNSAPTGLDLVFFSVQPLSLSLIVLVAAAIGAAVTAAGLAWTVGRLRLDQRRQARRIVELEQELHGLRTLPLGDAPGLPAPPGPLPPEV